MKKIIIVFLALFIPLIVLAQDECPRPISGGGSSFVDPADPGRGCSAFDGNTCDSDRRIGVRFQFLKVESKTDVQLLGYFDVWDGNLVANSRISKPSNNDLYNKLNCANVKVTNLAQARAKRDSFLIPLYDANKDGAINDTDKALIVQEYVDDKYGNVYFDSSLRQKYDNGEMATWAFYYEGSTPKSGYLYTYFFKPMLDGYYDQAAALFGMTKSDLDAMSKAPNKYYITAEVLYGHMDANGTDYYLMPVSESGYTHGARSKYVAIITTPNDGDTTGLVPNYINKVSPDDVRKYMNFGYGYNDNSFAYKATCNNAYGWEAWNIEEVCPPCKTNDTCDSVCDDYEPDTAERLACATSWCKINEPDNATCVSSCREAIPDDAGCQQNETDGKRCSDYKTAKDSNSSKQLKCSETNQAIINNKTHLSSKICYDDDSDFSDGQSYALGAADFDVGTKFYKIVCETTFDFKDLPKDQYIFLDPDKTMSIKFSYRVEFNKSCQLKYKIATKYKTASTGLWTTNYSKSRIKYDIDSLTSAAAELTTLINDPETSDEDKAIYQETLTNINAMKTRMVSLKDSATTRLATLTQGEAPEKIIRNDIELKLYDYQTYSEYFPTEGYELLPAICVSPEDETGTRLICLFNNYTEEQYITVGGKTLECRGGGGKYTYDPATNTGTYSEVVYYTLPDSYIGAHSDNFGPYHTIRDCEDAVAESNGFCKIVEYAYVLKPFDGTSIGTYVNEVSRKKDKLVLKFEAGDCNEFEFTYKCDYQFETKFCEECSGIPKGTDEYISCLDTYCGCDKYCGTNLVCRAKYCPNPCIGCNWEQYLEDDTCEECENACDDLKAAPVKDYISCVYDECCFNKCNADEACLLKCCQSKCKRLYSGDAVKYNKCIKEECPDPPDDHPCVGDCSDDYIFRSVSLYDPFPDRGTDVGIIGKNWYNKERIITEANDARSVYFDNTSGFDERYEYGIKINSKQLKKVKEMVKKEKQTINDVSYWGSTSYKFFNKSTSFTSPVSRYAYCSKFLYEDLSNLGIDVTTSEAQLYCRRQA